MPNPQTTAIPSNPSGAFGSGVQPDFSMSAFAKAATPMQGLSMPAAAAPAATATSPDFSMAAFQSAAAKSVPLNGPTSAPPSGLLQDATAGLAKGANDLVNLPFQAANYFAQNAGKPVVGERMNDGSFMGKIATPQDVANWKPTAAQAALANVVQKATAGPQALQDDSAKLAASPTGQAVSKYVNQANPQGGLGNAAYAAGEMLPFALAPEEGGPAFTARLAKLSALGAASGAAGYTGQDIGGDTGQIIGSIAGAATAQGLGIAASKGFGMLGEAMTDSLPLTAAQRAAKVNHVATQFGANEGESAASQVTRLTTPGVAVPLPGGAKDETVPLGVDGEIIPGSRPTTAQLTGNAGLANLEAARAREAGGNPLYSSRYSAQAGARAGAIANLEPLNSTPSQVGEFARESLDRINANNDAAQNAAMIVRDQSVARTGGELSAGDYGAQAQDKLIAAHQAASAQASRFWNDLDERNPTINVAPLKAGARDITDTLAATKRPISGAEQSIYDRAAGLEDDEPWAVVGGLRKDLGEQIRGAVDQNGLGTEARRRLVQLRSALDNATATAMERQAATDANNGVDPAEAWGQRLLRQDRGWDGAQADVEQRAAANSGLFNGAGGNPESLQGAGPSLRAGSEVSGLSQSSVISSASRPMGSDVGAGNGPPRDAASPQDVPSQSPITGAAWTQLDQDTYDAANAATFQKKQNFGNSTIGPIIGKKGVQPILNDAEVARKLFPGGVKSQDAAKRFYTTLGSDPDAPRIYQDLAAAHFRNFAVDSNGNISVNRAQTWLRNHGSGLDVTPGLREKFENPIKAQQTVNDATIAAKEQLKAFQKTELARMVGGDPVQHIGNVIEGGTSRAENLIAALQDKPDLQEAAKAAAARYINQRFTQHLLTGDQVNAQVTAGRLREFLTKRGNAVRTLMGDDAVNSLRRVVADYDRSNISRAGRTAGMGSPTGANIRQSATLSEPTTKLGKALEDKGGPIALLTALSGHPYVAAAATALKYPYKMLQASSRAKYETLLDEVLLNPKTAAEVLRETPGAPEARNRWSARIARLAYPGFATSINQRSNQP